MRLRRSLGYLALDFGVYPRVSAHVMLDHMAVLKGFAGKAERKVTVETLLEKSNLSGLDCASLARAADWPAQLLQRNELQQTLQAVSER